MPTTDVPGHQPGSLWAGSLPLSVIRHLWTGGGRGGGRWMESLVTCSWGRWASRTLPPYTQAGRPSQAPKRRVEWIFQLGLGFPTTLLDV